MSQFQTWYRMQPPALRVLLTINVAIYLVWQLVFLFGVDSVKAVLDPVTVLDARIPDIVYHPWQLVTYNFTHMGTGLWGFIHILFNMLWLVWVGREFEEMHGTARMATLYVFAGMGGAILTVFLHGLMPGVGAFYYRVYGASASVLGLMMAVGILYPYKSVSLFGMWTVRLVHLVLGFLVLDILFMAGSSATSVSAHAGGALFGFVFARLQLAGFDPGSWGNFMVRRKPRARVTPIRRRQEVSHFETFAVSEKEIRAARPTGTRAGGPAGTTFVSQSEIDRILDKISEKGFEALTDEEKRTLEQASKR